MSKSWSTRPNPAKRPVSSPDRKSWWQSFTKPTGAYRLKHARQTPDAAPNNKFLV